MNKNKLEKLAQFERKRNGYDVPYTRQVALDMAEKYFMQLSVFYNLPKSAKLHKIDKEQRAAFFMGKSAGDAFRVYAQMKSTGHHSPLYFRVVRYTISRRRSPLYYQVRNYITSLTDRPEPTRPTLPGVLDVIIDGDYRIEPITRKCVAVVLPDGSRKQAVSIKAARALIANDKRYRRVIKRKSSRTIVDPIWQDKAVMSYTIDQAKRLTKYYRRLPTPRLDAALARMKI
jgi:hypothetical protein